MTTTPSSAAAAAATIQVVTQNGTNQFHGSVLFQDGSAWTERVSELDRKLPACPTTPQRNTSRFNDLGGSIGGPILKNKLFFFFAYDTIRNSSTAHWESDGTKPPRC